MVMFWRGLSNGGKIAIFDQYVDFTSMTVQVSSVVNSFDSEIIYSTKRRRLFIAQTVAMKRHTSANLVYNSNPYAEENRTEFNCTHW